MEWKERIVSDKNVLLGKPVIKDQIMSILNSSSGNIRFVYQLYVPDSWDSSEIIWEIYYLDRLIDTGGIKLAP